MFKNILLQDTADKSKQVFFAFAFFIFTILALSIDSVFVTKHYFDARIVTNLLALFYFSLLLYFSDVYLRKLMLVMVPLSYIGELIFCKALGFYDYRTDAIPFYVPFGHAIVYASGYILADLNWPKLNSNILTKVFIVFYTLLFVILGIGFKDYFSLVFGILFFLLVRRKRWENLYFFIAICVIFIELTGTFFGCWIWKSEPITNLSTLNPPMGAVFFYAGGDVLLAKIVSYWKN